MARKAQEAAEESELRSQMYKHELFVEWAGENGVDLNSKSAAEVIAYFAAKRNDFRKSDTYLNGVEAHKGEAEAAKAERAAMRAANAKEAKPAKAAKATKAAKKAPAKKAAPAKATRKGARAAAAAASDDSPFD